MIAANPADELLSHPTEKEMERNRSEIAENAVIDPESLQIFRRIKQAGL